MAENSNIEWTTHTWNPWRGCTKVSAGCANCYAETLSGRNPGTLGVWGPNGTRVVASEAMWKLPLKWNRDAGKCPNGTRFTSEHMWKAGRCLACGATHPRVFCASLADVFEDWQGLMCASDGGVLHACNECGEWRTMERMCHGPLAHYPLTMQGVRTRLFDLIDATPNLDWLLLTKRPENIAKMMPPHPAMIDGEECNKCVNECRCPRPNLWLGTSVENQAAADARIPHLLRVPAAVRFLSCEPLLSEVNLTRCWLPDKSGWWNALDGRLTCKAKMDNGQEFWCETEKPLCSGIDWVIVGGESGPGARPCNVAWIRSIVEQCKAAGVPVFVKQLGAVPHGKCGDGGGSCLDNSCCRIPLRDKKGGDMAEWHADLRVRQFPAVEARAS
jgi:protein gp37